MSTVDHHHSLAKLNNATFEICILSALTDSASAVSVFALMSLLLLPSVAATTATTTTIATAGVAVVVMQAKGLHDHVLEEGRENATSWDSGEGQVQYYKL